MKKLVTMLFLLLFGGNSTFAQDMLGIRNSNYAGIQGLGMNPASIHTSRIDIDINLIGIGATIENDFIYIPQDELKFFGIKNIMNKMDNKEYLDEFQFQNAEGLYNAYSAVAVYGPGAMFNIKNKHTFAITTQFRHHVSANDVDGHIAKYAVEGLGYDPLHGNVFSATDFQLNILNWLEYGLSYATTLKETEKGSLTMGVTLKLLNGLAGAYAENPDLRYDVLNDSDMVFLPGSSIDYGRTDYNSFDEVSNYGDFVNGSGFGADIGFTYDFLKDPSEWQYEMDGAKQHDPTLNRYKLRLGFSVIDLGKINFKDNSGVYHLETNDIGYYNDYNVDEFDDNIDFDKSMSAIFYNGDSLASFRNDDFKMNLPTALSLQVDWNAYKKFYVNAAYTQGIKNSKPGVDKANVLSVTPRYETKWFDVSLPISYYNYASDVTRIGLAMRFASFYIGSDRIGSLFGLSDMYGMDVYAGLKFSINKERTADYDGDRISDAKDKCREIAGLLKFEGCPDRDLDDVPDAIDQCPDVKGTVALAGCPDTDGDGITDAKDDCPTTPGLPQFNGCPDTDGDGITDAEDECPSIAGILLYKGCPDTDGDSIPDPQDDCPTTKGLPEYKGCPDSDGDGLPDPQDNCPFDVGPVSNKGCPVKITQAPVVIPAKLTEEEQEIINKVFSNLQFETGKAVIKESSFASLDALALMMNKRTSFKLNIDGHTDNTGSAATNKTLSKKRADAAKTYLVSKNVDSTRINSQGFGKDKPIADNKTAEGRAKNRRVEFLLFE